MEKAADSEAERLKEEGNAFYLRKDYLRAAELYEKAISCSSLNPVFHFNAARAYKELGRWREAEQRSARALELNLKYIKAWVLNGKCLIELGKYDPRSTDQIDRGIANIREGIALCSGQKRREFEQDAMRSLKNGLKIRWHKQQDIMTREGSNLADYFEGLVRHEVSLTEEQKRANIDALRKLLIPEKKRKSDIPEYLLCDYSGELMENPVITSEGYTYERDRLAEFTQKNGNIDPVTRYKIDPARIYPNLSIKEATEEFLEKHPWAYEYKGDEDYKNVGL